MTAYDDWKCIDTQADKDAANDAKLAAAREAVVITGYELGEQLPFLTDAQFQQFCTVVAGSDDEHVRYMVRLICADVIENKARQMVEVRK